MVTPIGEHRITNVYRLITDEIARLLAKVKWIKRIRFGCDTPGQIAEVERASALIDKYGYKGEYFLYCILCDHIEIRKILNESNT